VTSRRGGLITQITYFIKYIYNTSSLSSPFDGDLIEPVSSDSPPTALAANEVDRMPESPYIGFVPWPNTNSIIKNFLFYITLSSPLAVQRRPEKIASPNPWVATCYEFEQSIIN
jgi:hypothetical protein